MYERISFFIATLSYFTLDSLSIGVVVSISSVFYYDANWAATATYLKIIYITEKDVLVEQKQNIMRSFLNLIF